MNRTLRATFSLLAVTVLVLALVPKPFVADHEPTPVPMDVPDRGGRIVVDLVDDDWRSGDADLLTIEQAVGADLDWTHAEHSLDDGLIEGWVPDMDDAVAALAGHPLVEVVEPEIELQAFGLGEGAAGFPNDPLYEKQWHMKAMGAPVGWDTTPRGKGVVVAVVDTGVAKVEDLDASRVLEGASFVPGNRSSNDDNGHGTHCAGTIAQTTNNGVGVTGVAPEAKILPVKVLSGMGFGSSGWIASGVDYAVDNGADVISLSLGGGYSVVIHNSIKKARDKGVIVVAAAGNSGREGVSYPGALKETIGVSATGPDGLLSFYSSWGKGVDIAAPGGNKKIAGGGVWQDTIDGKGGHHYAEYQGTSMATPHVAGAAAVLLSTGMDPEVVQTTLLNTAKKAPGQSAQAWDPKYGHGSLDLSAALGKVIDKFGAIRFGLAALMVLMVTNAANLRTSFRAGAAAIAGVVGGGLFFLDWLPIPENVVVELLARPLLLWPAVFASSSWVNFPLWLSCLVPAGVVFTLGAFKNTRPIALGVTCGVGAHLIHGAATGSLNPWWMPGGLEVVWLVGNAIVCLLLGLAVAGAEKIEEGSQR